MVQLVGVRHCILARSLFLLTSHLDGANIEIAEEVGENNVCELTLLGISPLVFTFIFSLLWSFDTVSAYNEFSFIADDSAQCC